MGKGMNEIAANNPLYVTDSGVQNKLPQPTALNTVTQIDADALNVRPYEFNLLVAQDRIVGHSWVTKVGVNEDIDTGSVPEDIWGGGGQYAGFPTGSPEIFTAVSTSASDTGTLTITYLATENSTAYQTAIVTLNGTTPVDFAVSGIRIHTMSYQTGSATTFNLGTISCYHKITTSNIFQVILPGTSQSNGAAYRVPAGCTAFLYEYFFEVIGGTTSSIRGSLWLRTNGGSPRLRRPFKASLNADHMEDLKGQLPFPEKTDITLRVTLCTENNVTVIGGFTLLLVEN